MYGTAKISAATTAIPASTLTYWSQSLAIAAFALIALGMFTVVRNLRSQHRP